MGGPEADLEALFREVASEHHRAFAATDGFDPEWPEWYAGYLTPRLGKLLGRAVDESEIAESLRLVEAERQEAGAEDAWEAYYAAWFVGRYGR